MSHLLARIMLALLMLPLAAVAYTLMLFLLADTVMSDEVLLIMTTNVTVAALVATYWVLLWRSTVRWTASRITLSLLAIPACALGGLVIGVMDVWFSNWFGSFIGGVFAITTWPAVTVLIWRERASERIGRLQRAGAGVLPCPRCGYNLTGLRAATCPECGASFTLDELLTEHRQQELKDEGGD